MNVKESSWFPALAVGIVISVVQLYVAKQSDRGDTLVAVATKVEYLTAAVKQLTEQPYVRREDLSNVEGRVSGLEQRVSIIEREEQSHSYRQGGRQ